jgi:hypothetical protein
LQNVIRIVQQVGTTQSLNYSQVDK